jgi:hypothetical protein
MVPGLQPSGRYNGSGCRSRTHSVCTQAGSAWAGEVWGPRGRGVFSGIEVGEAGRRAVRYKKGDVMGARRGMCACLEGVGEAAMVVRQGYGNVRRPRLLAFRVLMSG